MRGAAAEAIRAINAAGRPVFAIDIPSGLDSDSGMPLGEAVRADSTVTFVALKTGLFLGEGPERAGRIFFDDLEVPVPDIPQFSPRLQRITETCVVQALPRRARARRTRVISAACSSSAAAWACPARRACAARRACVPAPDW